jgi:hypothetical protein
MLKPALANGVLAVFPGSSEPTTADKASALLPLRVLSAAPIPTWSMSCSTSASIPLPVSELASLMRSGTDRPLSWGERKPTLL